MTILDLLTVGFDFKYIFNLLQGGDKSAEDILRERFAAKNSNIDAFSSIRYDVINNEKYLVNPNEIF